MKLIINGTDYGTCTKYKQDRAALFPGWVFLMENGIEIRVPFYIIKLFSSTPNLELILHQMK